MITKAYIEEIIDAYHYRVRMPIYDQIKSSSTATPRAMLPIATVCGMAGTFYNFKVDDIVYVAVENGERDNIVILGSFLYQDSKTTPPDVQFSHVQVDDEIALGDKAVSDLPSGGGTVEQKPPYVASDTPPADTSIFWVDTSDHNIVKIYLNQNWIATGSAWT